MPPLSSSERAFADADCAVVAVDDGGLFKSLFSVSAVSQPESDPSCFRLVSHM